MIAEKILFNKCSTISVLLIAVLFLPISFYAQKNDSSEIKRLQRSIFVFNFAQQVSWDNFSALKTFKIGVLGPDRTVLDLTSMAQKRKVLGKNVEIVRFQNVKDIRDIQLLYVNYKYNYDIAYILRKVSGKKILIVSEDYKYNTSMINMLNVGDSFEYEINISKLQEEGFQIAPSLKQYAITSAQKWKSLYASTEESLEKTKEKNEVQKNLIIDSKERIKEQQEEIRVQKESISELWTATNISKKKYEEKLKIEKELEESIKQQFEVIKKQEESIENSSLEIANQLKYLEKQNIEISEKQLKLKEQDIEINRQRKINILLVSLILIVMLGSFFIYWGYRRNKKLNKILQEKNREIHQQSVELISKNQELEQFAYIASHDLQEPLNTITSFIDLISEDYGDSFDDVGKESLVFITDASVRMKRLIDALLEYSRLGRVNNKSTVDLNKVLDELLLDLKTVIERTKTTINKDNLPLVNGSDVELRLLFQNLISNGIKFTAASTIPEITISIDEKIDDGDSNIKFWEFAVQDNGIGIPEIHKERIFSIFQRLHTRDQYEGTGIGLAHCKKIIESHGGTIWLESTEGKGTTFYFTIPK